MSDNIRQEAVERNERLRERFADAREQLRSAFSDAFMAEIRTDEMNDSFYEADQALADVFAESLLLADIDASGLIEQLTEAIAQRDEARGHLATASEHLQSLFAQLAAERALCDRLADLLRRGHLSGPARALALTDLRRPPSR